MAVGRRNWAEVAEDKAGAPVVGENWKGPYSCHRLITLHRRTATSITCTVPGGTLPALVPVCVRFESRGCVHGNLTFWYMQNPVITAIRPGRSPVR